MRYFYRAYPAGTLRLEGRRQLHELQRDSAGGEPVPDGAAHPVVFISGAWQRMDDWLRHAEYANRFATVILVDPPGNGRADAAPASCGLDFFEAVFLQVLEAERLSRVSLLAFSYGVPIAFRLAWSRPELVHRVVLVGAAKRLVDAQREAIEQGIACLRRRHAGGFADCLARAMLCQDPRLPIRKRRIVERILRMSISRMAPGDYRKSEQNALRMLLHVPDDDSRNPDVPVLVTTGEHDPFATPDAAREMAWACSCAAFTMIREADHLVYLERPRVTMDLALNFFRGLPLEGARGCTPIEHLGRRVAAEAVA